MIILFWYRIRLVPSNIYIIYNQIKFYFWDKRKHLIFVSNRLKVDINWLNTVKTCPLGFRLSFPVYWSLHFRFSHVHVLFCRCGNGFHFGLACIHVREFKFFILFPKNTFLTIKNCLKLNFSSYLFAIVFFECH